MSNRSLIILFLILAAVVAAVLIYDGNKGERSFRKELVQLTPESVTAITIVPKGVEANKVRLVKSSQGWQVTVNGKDYPADTAFISNLLQVLGKNGPERVAGIDKESWKEYEVTDSAATHVVVEEGGRTAADLRVGKVTFSQNPQAQSYGRNQNPIIKSYVRAAGDDRVYQLDGYLSLMFRNEPGQYRDKTICRFQPEEAEKLTFTYPGDSSFVLLKREGRWFVNEVPADSAATARYLQSISALTGNEFSEEEANQPHYSCELNIERPGRPGIVIRGAADRDQSVYLLHSSMNPSALFRNTGPSVFDRVFVSRTKF